MTEPLFLTRHRIARRYRVPASELTGRTARELEDQARRIRGGHQADRKDAP